MESQKSLRRSTKPGLGAQGGGTGAPRRPTLGGNEDLK